MQKISKRRKVREKVLQVLYAFEMNNDSLKKLMDMILVEINDENDKKFGVDLINRVVIHREELDIKIKEKVSNWEMNRIALIDKLLLRIALCEIIYFDDIPPKVSINEAIEISKNFSTAGSSKFINGILDAILADEKSAGRLIKSGRGLVDKSISKFEQKKTDE